MPEWRSRAQLEDHYWQHRDQFPGQSVDQYDASAKEKIVLGVKFTSIDRVTHLRRTGYFHRDSSRFTVLDVDGYIHSHFRTDEAYIADLIDSTYKD